MRGFLRNQAEPSAIFPAVAKRVPGIAQSVALCSLFFGVVFVVWVMLRLLSRFTGMSLDMSSAALVHMVIAWMLALRVGVRWSKVSFREVYPLTSFSVRIVPALLIASVGVNILLTAAALLIPMPEAFKIAAEEMAGSSKLAQFFVLVLVGPLAEELFFRGWCCADISVATRLRSRFGCRWYCSPYFI